MHRFAKPPGVRVDRGETSIRRSGSRIRNSGSTPRRVAFAHAKPSGRTPSDRLPAGRQAPASQWRTTRPGPCGKPGRKALQAAWKEAARDAFCGGAGWQGARNVTELVCCVTNEKYRCFREVFCVSGFPERRSAEPGNVWITARDRDGFSGASCLCLVVSRQRAATRSRDVTSLYLAAPFRQNWSYACAEFAKPFCFASSHGRSHRWVVSHHE